MDMTQIKPLLEKTLDIFCSIFDFCNGEADITCPASTYPTACLRALERRGLIQWDTERVKQKTRCWVALTKLGAYYGCQGLALVPTATKTRNRQWVKVQFDLDKAEYAEAYRIAGELARRQLLAPTMRDWLLIHAEFADKDTTTFAKAYPAIHKLMTEAKQDDLLSRLEAALNGINSSDTIGLRKKTPEGKEPALKLEIRKDETAGKRASENYIKSVLALQGKPQVQGIRKLDVPSVPMPVFEDD